VAFAFPTGASAAVTCEYRQLGMPGPRDNELRIATAEFGEAVAVSRAGAELRVHDDSTGIPVACSSTTPTVTNIDVVEVVAEEPETSFYLDLQGGRFEPGATHEGGLGSEIEFRFAWEGGLIGIGGASGRDVISFGQVDGAPAANLNPYAEGQNDADLMLADLSSVLVRGRGGDDSITARGGPEFAGPLRHVPFNVQGGPAGDLVRAGPAPSLITGGSGRDLLLGGRSGDELNGGSHGDRIRGQRGRDELIGGGGRDVLLALDRDRDRVRCGRHEDRVRADPEDEVRDCEERFRA
jgi:RTX calcium-binding nonapeptide repeat (4 copies)